MPRVCCTTAETAADPANMFRVGMTKEPYLGVKTVERERICVWAWVWTTVVVAVAVVGRVAGLTDRARRLFARPDIEEEERMQRAIESLLAIFLGVCPRGPSFCETQVVMGMLVAPWDRLEISSCRPELRWILKG